MVPSDKSVVKSFVRSEVSCRPPVIGQFSTYRDMSTLGTIALALAIPTYLLVLHSLLSVPAEPKAESDPTLGLLGAVGLVVLWLCLAVALIAALSAGAFSWVASNRLVQLLLVFSSHIAAGCITWFSMLLRHDPDCRIPLTIRPLAPWAAYVLPPIALIGTLLMLHPSLTFWLPSGWNQSILGIAGVASLVAMSGAIVECITQRFRPPNSGDSCIPIL